MTTETAKLRLKYGNVEVEYEGEKAFLDGGFVDLLREASQLLGSASQVVHSPITPALPAPHHSGAVELGMGSVAAKLNATSGPELVIAAAAYLTFVRGVDRLGRRELLAEMRNATAYFKENMAGNLTAALNSLVKAGRVNEITKDVYALSASERASLESKLVE